MGRVVTQNELIVELARRKRNGERIVFTNGCFDLLHPGHVRDLEWARSQGDCLIVAINSDASVRRLKGADRPVVLEKERAEVLAAFAAVDLVVVFEEDTPRDLITNILDKARIDALVKGGNWGTDQIVGRKEVEAAGGRVLPGPLEDSPSTTNLIEKIRSLPPDLETGPAE